MVPKVVLDTNIIVSAFGWRGSPHQILRRCITGDFRLHLSPALLLETTRVLAYPKFGFNQSQIDEFAALVFEIATMVHPTFTVDIVTADPSDNRVLECAIAAGCPWIVSGDRHLLELSNLHEIQVFTPDVFLTRHPVQPR